MVNISNSPMSTLLESTMVDVSSKNKTVRRALAQSKVVLTSDVAYETLKNRELEKGDAVKIAEVAGLMASKRTSDLIPLCHQIALDWSKVRLEFLDDEKSVVVLCET